MRTVMQQEFRSVSNGAELAGQMQNSLGRGARFGGEKRDLSLVWAYAQRMGRGPDVARVLMQQAAALNACWPPIDLENVLPSPADLVRPKPIRASQPGGPVIFGNDFGTTATRNASYRGLSAVREGKRGGGQWGASCNIGRADTQRQASGEKSV